MADCPFCPDNWVNLTITERYGPDIAFLVPLNPVVPGHRLVISDFHSTDVADNPQIAAQLMFSAALYVRRNKLQANIITSIGPDATQTVMHTHLHIVPRQPGDGLDAAVDQPRGTMSAPATLRALEHKDRLLRCALWWWAWYASAVVVLTVLAVIVAVVAS